MQPNGFTMNYIAVESGKGNVKDHLGSMATRWNLQRMGVFD